MASCKRFGRSRGGIGALSRRSRGSLSAERGGPKSNEQWAKALIPYDKEAICTDLQKDLQSLLEGINEKDVTLQAGDTAYELHNFIIKARCPFLYQKLQGSFSALKIQEEEENELHGGDFYKTVQDLYTAISLKKEDIEEKVMQLYKVKQPSEGEATDNSEGSKGKDYANTTSQEAGCCALGTDLLVLLDDPDTSDVTITVAGKYILAHRQLLAVRSTYFEAMLHGAWSESDKMIVNLRNVSYEGVMFVLKFIYGGVCAIPSDAAISEILQIADMYGLDLLKDIVAHHLKQLYCHNFHKPCSNCVCGVVDVVLLTWTFGPKDLYEECVRWISHHYSKLFVSKEVIRVRPEIRQECINTVMNSLTPDKIIDELKKCETMWSRLPDVRATAPLREIVKNLEKRFFSFTIVNLDAVVTSVSFLDILKGIGWSNTLLERILSEIRASLTVNNCCGTLSCLQKVLESIALVESQATKDGLESPFCQQAKTYMETAVNDCMVFTGRHIRSLHKTKSWKSLRQETKDSIKGRSGFFDFAAVPSTGEGKAGVMRKSNKEPESRKKPESKR